MSQCYQGFDDFFGWTSKVVSSFIVSDDAAFVELLGLVKIGARVGVRRCRIASADAQCRVEPVLLCSVMNAHQLFQCNYTTNAGRIGKSCGRGVG